MLHEDKDLNVNFAINEITIEPYQRDKIENIKPFGKHEGGMLY